MFFGSGPSARAMRRFLCRDLNSRCQSVSLMQTLSRATPPFVYCHEYSCTWPDNHRFPMSKFHDLFDYLTQNHAIDPQDLIKPIHPFDNNGGDNNVMKAARECHDEDYLKRVLTHSLSDREKRRIGLYDRNEHAVLLPRRSFAEVGGTCLTVDLALRHGMSCNLSGGTHHAAHNHGSGFCVVNDIGIACIRALSLGHVKKILVFDCDVHQGDGTARLFKDNDSVYTVSLHCEENFPFTKALSDMDVGMLPGTDDETYMQVCEKTLLEAIEISQPDLVIYDAGVDVSNDDALGKLSLTNDGIYQRELLVLSTCRRMNIPIAGIIGGGYSKGGKIALASKHAKLHLAAIEVWNTFDHDTYVGDVIDNSDSDSDSDSDSRGYSHSTRTRTSNSNHNFDSKTQQRRREYENRWLEIELDLELQHNVGTVDQK